MKWTWGLALALAMATTMPPATAQDAVAGGTLTVAVEGDFGFLDPAVSSSGLTHTINDQIFEKLFAYDNSKPNDGTPPPIVPRLATGFELSSDGLTYTIHLREGVKFHDGTDFDANAVDFNIRRVWDKNFQYYYGDSSGLGASAYGFLTTIEIVDPHTIKLTLSEPFSFFIDALAAATGLGLPWMLSPQSVITYGNDEVRNHPSGTGAFRFVSVVPGQQIVLEKNPDYWDKAYPKVGQLVFVPMPEPSTRVNALLAGEVDIIGSVPPDQIAPLRDAGMTIAQGPTPHIWYLEFNQSEPPFNDLRVREAVSLAIDRQSMADTLLAGTALPALCFCARTSPSVNPPPDWTGYEYNPEKAKQLLVEAGYPNGFNVIYETSTAGSGQMLPVEMGAWIQQDLAAIGITVDMRTYEWNTYGGMWYAGLKPGIGMNQISYGSNTDYWISQAALSTAQANSGHHTDKTFDSFLLKANTVIDRAERDELIRQALKEEKEQMLHAPIVNDTMPMAAAPRVKGLIRAADWTIDYRTVSVTD